MYTGAKLNPKGQRAAGQHGRKTNDRKIFGLSAFDETGIMERVTVLMARYLRTVLTNLVTKCVNKIRLSRCAVKLCVASYCAEIGSVLTGIHAGSC